MTPAPRTRDETNLQRRFDRAIAHGPAVACAIEPGAEARELADIDGLRGRPFFQSVERMAAAAAAERPATWRAPETDPARVRASMDAVANDAEDLRAEVEATCPHTSVHVLPAEDRLQAYLTGQIDDLGQEIYQRTAARAGRVDARDVYAETANVLQNTDAISYGDPCALSKALPDPHTRDTAATFHLAVSPSRAVDPSINRAMDIDQALTDLLQTDPEAGYRARLDPAADARYSNDHEIGHLVDHATDPSLHHTRHGAHDTYLAECRADSFALAMTARRGGDVDALAAHITEERDLGAVLIADTEHWTTPVVAAMRTTLSAPGTRARLQAMTPGEIMDDCRRVTDAHALSADEYPAFRADLKSRVEGDSLADPADPPNARAATDTAMAGYARARVATAHGPAEALRAPDDGWERAARAGDPRNGALALLGSAMAGIDHSLSEIRHHADTPAPSAPALALASQHLLASADRLLYADERHARTLDGADGPRRDYVRERARLATLDRQARDIAKAPDSRSALWATLRLCDQTYSALTETSRYTTAARTRIPQTQVKLARHIDEMTPPARDRARSADGDDLEIPF